MSALDQAFIKAYAKDSSPVAVAIAQRALEGETPAAPYLAVPGKLAARLERVDLGASSARAIDEIYHAGVLYRVEAPVTAPRRTTSVPAPHVKLLPPTSPRRNMRRSVLKLLASQAGQASISESAAPRAEEPQGPRYARKVIIRHVAHTAPAPLGLLGDRTKLASSEPAPERIDEFGQPPQPTLLAEQAPARLPVAPENSQKHAATMFAAEPQATSDAIDTFCSWLATETYAPLVLVAEPAEIAGAAPEAVLTVQFSELPIPPATPPSEVNARLDPPQQQAIPRAHVRFDRPPEMPTAPEPVETAEIVELEKATELVAEEPAAESASAELPASRAVELNLSGAVASREALDADEIQSLLEDELTLAEPQEPVDLAEPVEPLVAAALSEPSASVAIEAIVPQWEVDRFHWPKACDKILADGNGYFAQAGSKLVAAARDGLKVLAVTGSRRGEGRTTLVMCLARAAAGAGLNVAILDADFNRPQIASKLGIEAAYNWQDAANGKVPLSEAAVKSLLDNITVLPLDVSAARSRLTLADPRVTSIIRKASASFDLVVTDLGPVVSSDELNLPPGESCPFDAAIVVRDLRFASGAESVSVGEALYDAGIDAVGIAENFVVEDVTVTAARS